MAQGCKCITVNVWLCVAHSKKWNFNIFIYFCSGEARHWALPLKTQCLKNSVESKERKWLNGESSVIILGTQVPSARFVRDTKKKNKWRKKTNKKKYTVLLHCVDLTHKYWDQVLIDINISSWGSRYPQAILNFGWCLGTFFASSKIEHSEIA